MVARRAPGRDGPPPLWRNRSFMLLWGGQVVSTLGSTAAGIIYPLLILAMTGSPAWAGFAGAARAVPYVFLSLPVGALIDRWDRKRVMILCDAGRAVAVASIPVAMALDAMTLWQIYAVAFVEGSLFVFFNIAEVAALPRVVPVSQLPQAAAQNEAAFGVTGIAGPSLGTFLFQSFGRGVPFIADALSYCVSIVSLSLIRTPFRSEPPAARRRLLAEIAEGLHWLWNKPLIRYMAIVTGGLNFIGAGEQLLIIVLAQDMGATDTDIGLIFSIASIGGIVGSLVGGRIQRRFTFGQVIIAVIWIQALLFPLFAVVPRVLLLGAVCALIFAMGPIYNVVQFSYRIALIPDQLQGRVNSTFRLVAFGFLPIGSALSGLLIEQLGTTWSVGLFSLGLLLIAIATTLNRHVRNAAPLHRIAPAGEPAG
jgi:MFS family permease